MVRLSLLLVLSLSLGALGAKTGAKGSTKAAAKADDGRCSPSKLCPKAAPCCSSAGYCGSGAEHCLAGCNPTSSFSPLSCKALPCVCRFWRATDGESRILLTLARS